MIILVNFNLHSLWIALQQGIMLPCIGSVLLCSILQHFKVQRQALVQQE